MMKTTNIITAKEKELEEQFGSTTVTIEKVGKYLNMSLKQVKKAMKASCVPTITSGRNIILTVSVFAQWLINPSHFISAQPLDKSADWRYNPSSKKGKDEFQMTIKGKGSIYPIKQKDGTSKYGCAYYIIEADIKRRKTKNFATFSEAEEFRNNIIDKPDSEPAEQPIKSKSESISGYTVEKLIDEFLRLKKPQISDNTYDSYRYSSKHILSAFGKRYIDDIRTLEINDFIVDGKNRLNGKPLGEKSKKEIFGMMKRVYNYALDCDYIRKTPFVHDLKPMQTVRPDPDKYFLSETEVSNLINFFNDNIRYQTIVKVLVNSGLRIGELLALTKNDLCRTSAGECYLNIYKSLKRDSKNKNTKSKASERIVYIAPAVMNVIDEWMNYVRSDVNLWHKVVEQHNEHMVFVNDDGGVINYQTLRNNIGGYMERHNWNGRHFNFHMLRHTYGSILYSHTRDLNIVRDVLGHADITTTAKHYVTITKKLKADKSNTLCLL